MNWRYIIFILFLGINVSSGQAATPVGAENPSGSRVLFWIFVRISKKLLKKGRMSFYIFIRMVALTVKNYWKIIMATVRFPNITHRNRNGPGRPRLLTICFWCLSQKALTTSRNRFSNSTR